MTDAAFVSSELLTTQTAIELASEQQAGNEQFLRLYLMPDTTVLLPVERLTEVLTLPTSQITPIAHLPAWVMGIYNWRGDILWMVDLGHLCGLTPWFQQAGSHSAHTAVVLNGEDELTGAVRQLGLVVSRVEEIEWCDREQIQSLDSATVLSQLSAFTSGYWWKPNDKTLAVLDAKAILAAMPT